MDCDTVRVRRECDAVRKPFYQDVLVMYLGVWVSQLFFFLKRKKAYELRISDWSSDVCSSDLQVAHCTPPPAPAPPLVATRARNCASTIDAIPNWRIEEIGRASCRERVCQYV